MFPKPTLIILCQNNKSQWQIYINIKFEWNIVENNVVRCHWAGKKTSQCALGPQTQMHIIFPICVDLINYPTRLIKGCFHSYLKKIEKRNKKQTNKQTNKKLLIGGGTHTPFIRQGLSNITINVVQN